MIGIPPVPWQLGIFSSNSHISGECGKKEKNTHLTKKYTPYRDLLHKSTQCSEKPSMSLNSFILNPQERALKHLPRFFFTHAHFHTKNPQLICEGKRSRALLIHYLLTSDIEEGAFDCSQRGSHIVHIYI